MEQYEPPCEECGGRCCDYVAIELTRPGNKSEYDHIRWYLVHENVSVFIDHEKKWYVQFVTTCTKKDSNNRCSIYPSRPRICSGHGNFEGECEYYSSPYLEYFSNESDFEKYLKRKNIDWKFKR
jgi:Fe-S-cluster containining protein